MADEILKRDQNSAVVLGGITDDSNQYIRMLRVDPITNRLLVSATGSTGTIAIGDTVTSGTDNSVLFINPVNTLAQSTKLTFEDTTGALSLVGYADITYNPTIQAGIVLRTSSDSVSTAIQMFQGTHEIDINNEDGAMGLYAETSVFISAPNGLDIYGNGGGATTIQVPNAQVATYTVNLPSGSGTLALLSDIPVVTGFATRALDNLASVSINTSLLAQSGVDAGSTTKPFKDLYLYGSGTYATTYLKLTGTPTSTRTLTLPDVTDTVAVLAASQALTSKTYNGLTLTSTTGTFTLTNAKTLTVSDSTTLATNAITLGGGEVITFSATNAFSLLTTGTTASTFPVGTKTLLATDGSGTGLSGIPYTLTGTANQVVLSAGTGNITFSLPQSIATSSNPQFATIELGAASDTTLARVSAGVVSIEGVTIDTISATNTLTNKRITKRVVTAADATSVTPNSDNADITYQSNTQATGTLTMNADGGTPTNGQSWAFKIKSTNAQTFSWNAIFKGGTTALPTVTVAGKIDYFTFIYDTVTPAWHYTGTAAGF